MRCEVCGRKIYGKPYRALIEGAKLTVCSECSKHGKILEEEPKPAVMLTTKLKTVKLQPLRTQAKESKPAATATNISELVSDFHIKIRRAREKLGLTHEDLGKKINEKVSLLKKVETGKMIPNDILATKLEHALKIKLLAPPAEEKIPKAKVPKPPSRELTLGDLIKLDKDKAEENT